MSDLEDDLISSPNFSKQKFTTEDEIKFESNDSTKFNFINISIDQPATETTKAGNGKRRTKTIKVKITISDDDSIQSDELEDKSTYRDHTSSKIKPTNRKICVIQPFENDLSPVILKTPEKEEIIEYISGNGQSLVNTTNYVSKSTDNEKAIMDDHLFTLNMDKSDVFLNNERVAVISSNMLQSTVETPKKSYLINKSTDEVINHPECDSETKRVLSFQVVTTANFLKNEQNRAYSIPGKNNSDDPLLTTSEQYNKSGTEILSESEEVEARTKELLNETINGTYKEVVINFLAAERLSAEINDKLEDCINKLSTIKKNNINTASETTQTSINKEKDSIEELSDFTNYDIGKCFQNSDSSIKEPPRSFTNVTLNGKVNNSEQIKEIRSKLCDPSFNIQQSKDSLIIHEIVMEHYYDVLNNLSKNIKRVISRSTSLVDEKEENQLVKESVQLSQNNLYDKERNEIQINEKVFKKELNNINKSMDNLEIYHENKEHVEYDAKAFLLEALGEDLMSVTSISQTKLDVNSKSESPTMHYSSAYGTQNSVGSSQISTLISTADYNVESLYSTVKKTSKKRSSTLKEKPVACTLFKTISTNSYNDYESIDKFVMNSKANEITREISILQNAIAQISKALYLSKYSPKFYGSTYHLEAERILLLSTYKMEILNNELNKYEYVDVEEEQNDSIIKIEKLKFSTSAHVKDKKNKASTQYYLCIIHSGTTALATDIIPAQKNGNIIFNNSFEFSCDSLLLEIGIKISIYSLTIRNKPNKKTPCFSPTKSYSPRKKESNNNDSEHANTSLFKLLGHSRIEAAELSSENKFKLSNLPPHAPICDMFDAEIFITLTLNNRLKGFLTICVGQVLWNRRWCVLDGLCLKYWNCPSQENEVQPAEIIELQSCCTNQISNAEKSICSRARTFTLDIKSKGTTLPKKYFLSADSQAEFSEWKRKINMALTVLRNCNKLKCQTQFLIK